MRGRVFEAVAARLDGRPAKDLGRYRILRYPAGGRAPGWPAGLVVAGRLELRARRTRERRPWE